MGEAATGPRPDLHGWMRDAFLRLFGAVYLVAFLSLWVQVEGLIGSRGILPIRELLDLARERLGSSRFWVLPTVFWISDGDVALHVVCASGALLSLVALLGRARALVMLGLWALYLSLAVAGEDFLAFQWDALLLEAGLLAVLLAPRGILRRHPAPAPLLIIWMYRWLLFRLMFGSGVVKLRSGDPTWRSLTALSYHYETQPLPTWIGFYAHHLPARVHVTSAAIMFAIELLLPLLIWLPPPWRRLPLVGFVGFQILIAATGNYAFFNVLTIALCVFLADPDLLPRRWRPTVAPGETQTSLFAARRARPLRRRGGPRLGGPVHGGHARRRPALAFAGHRAGARGLAPAVREQLWPVRGHDDDAAGDRGRRQRRRGDVARLWVSVQARRPEPPAGLRGPAPAAAGLADVVRGLGHV